MEVAGAPHLLHGTNTTITMPNNDITRAFSYELYSTTVALATV